MKRLPHPEIRIRPLRAGDAPALAAIDAQSNDPSWSAPQFERELQLKHSVALVAENTDGPVAFAIAWAIHGTAQLLQLAVRPDFRRRGIGRALLEAAMECSRARNCGRMELECRAENTAARNLYREFGFEVTGQRKEFYSTARKTSDAVLMECSLL